ncbi:hypothetical protein NUW58_g383 [Xylaria curta]|uniref:Uncharacterized protein n=1 Tax=Xylaria curta TaxID=42375 RepID=A0ACC1PR70_9PEZI|nr:hypothetical protein NUW58_g383 [Xylaria curta]
MFGTLKAGKKNNAGSMVFVEQNKQSRSSPWSPHNACKTCRERKLKCTGEATGCKRCKSSNVRCEYPSPTVREDRRGSKSRRVQVPAAAVGQEPPPVVPNAQGQSSQGNNQRSPEKTMSTSLEANTRELDMDFSVSSFPDPGLPDVFYDELHSVNTTAFLENMEQDRNSHEDPNILQHPFEGDLLADLELPPLDVTHYRTSSSDSDNSFSAGTSLGDNVDSTFMEVFLAPQVHWHQRDGPPSRDSPSISNKHTSSPRPRVNRPNTAPSKPTPSRSHSGSPFIAIFSETQPKSQPKSNSLESSSGSDSESSARQCRCSDRALRLLEKLPNTSENSSSPPPSVGSSELLSPERMDTTFPGEVKSGATNMTRAHFTQAATIFLGHFSQDLAVFSTISQCRSCLRKSSFSMILLMLAERLTSRITQLLQKYAHVPAKDSSSQKFMLTIAESAIEYDDPLPLISTLMAGKVCHLAACIARVKSVCSTARWTSYERGFEALETPLRERMGELEAMM